MKCVCLIILMSCFGTILIFPMMRNVASLITRKHVSSLIVRNCASKSSVVQGSTADQKNNTFKDVKETLGVSETVFFSLYLSTLTYFLFKQKSGCRYSRAGHGK